MKIRTLILALVLVNAAGAADPAATTSVMRQVFDWQVAHPWSRFQDELHGNRGWVQGAFLTGVMEAYRATGDAAYLDYAKGLAESNDWRPGPRPEHADDHIVGQTYLELHALEPAAHKIGPIKETMDALVAQSITGRELWWWCDALYMAPPTLAKLSQATGDARYSEAMDRWYWDSYEEFYDPAERLFYRDERYLFPKEGPKVFWSRGNGWVIAGIARLLDSLPADHPRRTKYIALFQAMAERLVQLQPADGLWRSDLLHPQEAHGEVSGSAFFCYALAWGVNQGLLPAEPYRAAAERAWAAMLECVDADGRLGWVQPIGFAPGAYDATTSQEYGAGAFLAAGGQIMKLPQ